MINSRLDLDPGFEPAVAWKRAFEKEAVASATPVLATVGLMRGDNAVARTSIALLPETQQERNFRAVERMIKFLLWGVGGNRILFSGPDDLLKRLQRYYTETDVGKFDSEIVGEKICGGPITVEAADEIPEPAARGNALGRHLDGCRIGFDLGGSDRKCAAVIDGKVVFSEEIPWDPYFESNPQYHFDGIMDSLKRAAAHLPRVDAIGGSAAGVYVDNEVRVASLFRGVSPADFEEKVRRIFFRVQEAWNGVPLDVVNDGEVTALAGAMSLDDNGVLGISMGTSLAAGYVTPEGNITSQLNELAFVPVDYREDGPVDEWSGDRGCGVQFFSQQGVARLARLAGLDFADELPLAERLVNVQTLMVKGDARARRIYETIGICFGYTIAHYRDFYDFRHLLMLGRVTSGEGGQVIIEEAETVLKTEFPELAETVKISMPDEQMKRHGQAVAAASLPALKRT